MQLLLILLFVVLIFLFSVLVLLFIIYSRRRRPESYAVGMDPDDDVRENMINYNEEGVGKSRHFFRIKLTANQQTTDIAFIRLLPCPARMPNHGSVLYSYILSYWASPSSKQHSFMWICVAESFG